MFEDENHAKLGVIEPLKHALMQSYPVMFEREGEYVARFMFTVILQPNGPLRITSVPFDPAHYKSELKIEDPALQAPRSLLSLLITCCSLLYMYASKQRVLSTSSIIIRVHYCVVCVYSRENDKLQINYEN